MINRNIFEMDFYHNLSRADFEKKLRTGVLNYELN